MRKLSIAFLSLLLLGVLLTACGGSDAPIGIETGVGESDPRFSTLSFQKNDDGKSYAVVGIGTCTEAEILIPASHKNLPVTRIGAYAFDGCNTVTRIVISARSVTTPFPTVKISPRSRSSAETRSTTAQETASSRPSAEPCCSAFRVQLFRVTAA